MITETSLRKIGNSQGVTIPREMCKNAGLEIGTRVVLTADESGISMRAAARRSIKDRLAEWDGVRYESQELDWGAPVGSEVW